MKKTILIPIIFFGIVILLLGAFSVMSFLSPIKAVKDLNLKYYDSAFSSGGTLKDYLFEKEAAFLQARTQMAETDSVCLSIDLSDSLVLLEMQGIMLLKARIIRIEKSNIFNRLHKGTYLEYFSKPLEIDSEYSTIPKEAFIIKQAPKDTTETAPPVAKPDTLHKEAVCFNLYLDRNLMIDIRQVDTIKNEQYLAYHKYLRKERISNQIRSLMKFSVPHYEPWIRIDIPAADAKSIYKAMPDHGQVAVKL
jgi:hypothetical protein